MCVCVGGETGRKGDGSNAYTYVYVLVCAHAHAGKCAGLDTFKTVSDLWYKEK